MNKSAPKISVVMSVYNGERYLREAVESVLEQNFTDFEFVIINDASTDSTGEILAEFARQDNRIILVENPENLGLTKSLNKGIMRSQGEYIARQDADDISLPERFSKQVAILDDRPEVVLVSCNIEKINAEGKPLSKMERACTPELAAWYLLFYNRLAGHSQVMFRRKTIDTLGGYSETYRYAQDYELWCRMTQAGALTILSEVLLQQRFHSNTISAGKQAEQDKYVLERVSLNVKELIEEELSLAEIENLKSFWIGNIGKYKFPPNDSASTVNTQLKAISQDFVQKYPFQRNSQRTYLDLQFIIGRQFIYWSSSQSLKNNFLKKFELLFYAFNWYPLAVIQYLPKFILRIPLPILN